LCLFAHAALAACLLWLHFPSFPRLSIPLLQAVFSAECVAFAIYRETLSSPLVVVIRGSSFLFSARFAACGVPQNQVLSSIQCLLGFDVFGARTFKWLFSVGGSICGSTFMRYSSSWFSLVVINVMRIPGSCWRRFALSQIRSTSLSVLFLIMLPAHAVAAEPIRLLIIPYQSGWGSQKIPVNQFTAHVAPPPLLLPPHVERVESRGIDSGDSVSDMDSDWLMDG
jgi:hypothetical protein